jgi:hypothetical protein
MEFIVQAASMARATPSSSGLSSLASAACLLEPPRRSQRGGHRPPGLRHAGSTPTPPIISVVDPTPSPPTVYYVNPKQYTRILAVRAQRERSNRALPRHGTVTIRNSRKIHAVRRIRGNNGRFAGAELVVRWWGLVWVIAHP